MVQLREWQSGRKSHCLQRLPRPQVSNDLPVVRPLPTHGHLEVFPQSWKHERQQSLLTQQRTEPTEWRDRQTDNDRESQFAGVDNATATWRKIKRALDRQVAQCNEVTQVARNSHALVSFTSRGSTKSVQREKAGKKSPHASSRGSGNELFLKWHSVLNCLPLSGALDNHKWFCWASSQA